MSGYLRGLDGLRAFAILWVMFGHVSAANKLTVDTAPEKIVNLIANMGWVGVQLFFVLSGFLITKILIENKGLPKQLRKFYIRRSLRIFPVYYFVLIIIFIIFPLFGISFYWLASDVDNQVWFWTYTNNWIRPFIDSKAFPHLWSLAIEEQYYLFWPFIVIFLNRNRLIQICLFMVISAPIFRFILFYLFEPEIVGLGGRAAYNFTFARWDALALGSLLAVLTSDLEFKHLLIKYSKMLLMLSSSLIVLQLMIYRSFNAIGEGGFELLNQTSSALLFFLVVFYVVNNQKNTMVEILEMKPFKYIGKYSYAMYIFHLPIMVVWFVYVASTLEFLSSVPDLLQLTFNFSAVLLISYIVSSLSWFFLEHPILKLKNRFT